MSLRAPFPYFGGKRSVADDVWRRLGDPKQYIEPFCGSLAILLAKKKPASLEVVGDQNCFIANVWRAVKHDPAAVAMAADYPVSHVDLGARHVWLMDQRGRLAAVGQAKRKTTSASGIRRPASRPTATSKRRSTCDRLPARRAGGLGLHPVGGRDGAGAGLLPAQRVGSLHDCMMAAGIMARLADPETAKVWLCVPMGSFGV